MPEDERKRHECEEIAPRALRRAHADNLNAVHHFAGLRTGDMERDDRNGVSGPYKSLGEIRKKRLSAAHMWGKILEYKQNSPVTQERNSPMRAAQWTENQPEA